MSPRFLALLASAGHQVVRRMALRQVGLEQGVGLVAEAGALEQVGGGGDHRLALVAVGDLAVGARRLLAHVGEQSRRAAAAARPWPRSASPSASATSMRARSTRAISACMRSARDSVASASSRFSACVEGGDAAPCARACPSRSARARSRPRSWSPCRSARASARPSPSSARTAPRSPASTRRRLLLVGGDQRLQAQPHRRRRARSSGQASASAPAGRRQARPWRPPAARRCPTNRRRAGASRSRVSGAGRRGHRRAPP